MSDIGPDPAESAPADEALDWKAEYGKLPFDRFRSRMIIQVGVGHLSLIPKPNECIQKNWNCSQPTTSDQEQWNDIARQWLALSARDRTLYRETTYALEDSTPGNPGLPSQEQIDRVLKPHQTNQEQNLAL